jgi:SAM-dependent methyltransferase
MDAIRADFDRIALVSTDQWNHNNHYHDFLLGHLPARCANVLEIGCGTGAFSRRLAQRSDRVLALDLSPQMIRLARERSREYTNIDYQVADVTGWPFPSGQFDCIASIATMHHLPLEAMLARLKEALTPAGTLLILDLVQSAGPVDRLQDTLAVPVSAALKLFKNGRLREPPEVQAAWAQHGPHDSYLTFAQVRRICTNILPGAVMRRHLLWRYSIVWRKKVGSWKNGRLKAR